MVACGERTKLANMGACMHDSGTLVLADFEGKGEQDLSNQTWSNLGQLLQIRSVTYREEVHGTTSQRSYLERENEVHQVGMLQLKFWEILEFVILGEKLGSI